MGFIPNRSIRTHPPTYKIHIKPPSPRPELDPARHFPPSALHQPLPPSALAAVGFVDEEGSSSSSSSLTPLELAARLRAVFCRGEEGDGIYRGVRLDRSRPPSPHLRRLISPFFAPHHILFMFLNE